LGRHGSRARLGRALESEVVMIARKRITGDAALALIHQGEQILGLLAENDALVERLRAVDREIATSPTMGLWAKKLALLIELKECEIAIRAWGAARGRHDLAIDDMGNQVRGVDWRSAPASIGGPS
jgi:hypothetical protein